MIKTRAQKEKSEQAKMNQMVKEWETSKLVKEKSKTTVTRINGIEERVMEVLREVKDRLNVQNATIKQLQYGNV